MNACIPLVALSASPVAVAVAEAVVAVAVAAVAVVSVPIPDSTGPVTFAGVMVATKEVVVGTTEVETLLR